MTDLYSIENLLENLEQIRKLKEPKKFRKYLKFFLIGFLIGRNNERRINELTLKNYDILSHLLNPEILEKNQNTIIKKFYIYKVLTRIEEILKSHKNDFSEFEYYTNLDKIYGFRIRFTDQARKKIEQRIEQKTEGLENQLNEILDSGTYLISSKKKECEASIETLEKELEQCKKIPILIIEYINENNIVCPNCKKSNFTDIRKFNLMFKTFQGVTEDSKSEIFLRPETAQGIFVNFKNVQRKPPCSRNL